MAPGPGPESRWLSARMKREREERREGGRTPTGHLGVNVAFVQLPWGYVRNGKPELWLMWISASGKIQDPTRS